MPKGVYRRGDPANRVARTCETCGAAFSVWAKEIAQGWGRFCTRACANRGLITLVDRSCAQCSAPFQAIASKVARGEGRFCNAECYRQSRTRPLAERLWARVDKSGECWLWTGPRMPSGYGEIGLGGRGGGVTRTHRLAYELTFGPIPEGLHVCHHCDVRHCVRPDHLFLGTRQDNMDDMVRKHRSKSPALKGVANGRSKLTEADVLAIRARKDSGDTAQQIAADYGITMVTVYTITNRQGWKHI